MIYYKVLGYLWFCCSIKMSKILYSIMVTVAVSKDWSEAGFSALRCGIAIVF